MTRTEPDELIGTAEVAEILGIDRSAVTRRAQAGDLTPAQKLPGKTGSHLYRRSEILALAETVEQAS